MTICDVLLMLTIVLLQKGMLRGNGYVTVTWTAFPRLLQVATVQAVVDQLVCE
jgi:hypothetical protein